MYVSRKLLPRHLSQHTKKHTVGINILSESGVSTFGSWWDGGSISRFSFVSLMDGRQRFADVSADPPHFGGEVKNLQPEKGWAVMVTGTFCGKTAHMRLHVRPDDIAFLVGEYGCPVVGPVGLVCDWLEDQQKGEKAQRLRELFGV